MGEHKETSKAPLMMRVSRDGDDWVIALHGELDLASAGQLERQLDEALADERGGAVVVDMRELEFIDSTGISLLVAAKRRDTGSGRLRLKPSESEAVSRLLEITGVKTWLWTG